MMPHRRTRHHRLDHLSGLTAVLTYPRPICQGARCKPTQPPCGQALPRAQHVPNQADTLTDDAVSRVPGMCRAVASSQA